MDEKLVAAIPVLAATAVVAVLVSYGIFRAVFRVWRTTFARQTWRRCRWAWRTAIAALAALTVLPARRLDEDVDAIVEQALVLVIIAALTWLALGLLRAGEIAALEPRQDVGTDDLRARRVRTRVTVMRRVGSALAIVVGLSTALLTFESARALGTSLLASAGLLGLVVGVAAQPSLRNLVAGVQIAFAEPIRLDDVVVVEGEWGTIEEITLTTVIVRVWDKRRLVYPTSWFTEHAFQNWTRRASDVLATVTLLLDHRADVASLRTAAGEVITSSSHWDGEAWNVQVTDADERGITVRVLASAPDAGSAWDLRCDVREELVAWLVANDPRALPVRRLLADDDGPGPTLPDRR